MLDAGDHLQLPPVPKKNSLLAPLGRTSQEHRVGAAIFRNAHYVFQPEVSAGDALIFNEALIHGTRPWTADQERRALLYKFSPGHSSWSQNYYDPDAYDNLTEQQARILAPPSVGSRPDSLQAAD